MSFFLFYGMMWQLLVVLTEIGNIKEMAIHKEDIVEKQLLELAFLGAKLGPEGFS